MFALSKPVEKVPLTRDKRAQSFNSLPASGFRSVVAQLVVC